MEKDLPKTITAQEVLDEAQLIRGERQRIYGPAYDNHRRIAELWSAYLDLHISPHQVAICMALTKISRLTHTSDYTNRDSYVDLASYAALAAECATYAD
jgi:hypothetical protein